LKIRSWLVLPVSSALALLGVSALAAPASASSGAAPTPLVRHYSSSGVVLAASGTAQCSTAVSARSGAWFCPAPASSARSAGVRPNISEYCVAEICYYRLSGASDEEEVQGSYGYGGTYLGDVRSVMTDTFNGGQSTTKPFWMISTRGIKSWGCSGERLVFNSSHPNGIGINNGASYQTTGGGSAGASAQENCWGSTGGYKQYDDGAAWGGIAHQFQWADPSFPGEWWFYAISPKFQLQSNGAYYLPDPMPFGPNPFSANWSAN